MKDSEAVYVRYCSSDGKQRPTDVATTRKKVENK